MLGNIWQNPNFLKLLHAIFTALFTMPQVSGYLTAKKSTELNLLHCISDYSEQLVRTTGLNWADLTCQRDAKRLPPVNGPDTPLHPLLWRSSETKLLKDCTTSSNRPTTSRGAMKGEDYSLMLPKLELGDKASRTDWSTWPKWKRHGTLLAKTRQITTWESC